MVLVNVREKPGYNPQAHHQFKAAPEEGEGLMAGMILANLGQGETRPKAFYL